MSTNVIFFGWSRPIPGREQIGAEHFQDFLQYLGGLQQAGTIQSFDTVLLSAHGGDMNGFFLIRGEHNSLDTVQASVEWQTHMIRAGLHLEGAGAIRGATGELIMDWMNLYTSLIPN